MLAITTYSFVSAFHVIFTILFLGVTFSFAFIAAAAQENPQHAHFALGITRKIQEVLVIPGGILIFATGIYLALDGEWFDRSEIAWLHIGMTWFLIAWLIGTFISYPSTKTMQAELAKQADNPGPPSELFQKKAALMNKVGPFLGISILVIAFLMVAKPF